MVQSSSCKLWNFSIASVLLLTFSNIVLIIKLLHNTDCRNQLNAQVHTVKPLKHPQPHQEWNKNLIIPNIGSLKGNLSYDVIELTKLNLKLGRWDNRHMFKLFDHIIVGTKFTYLTEEYTVCLATQSSLEKLYSLIQVANHWTGPISAAVYAAGDDELNLLLLYLVYLRQCFSPIKERVNFHLAYPKDRPPSSIIIDIDLLKEFYCTKPDEAIKRLLKLRSASTSNWRIRNAYPQNHLRNLARKNCQNSFVFLTDVDIVPSLNLADGLDMFLRGAQCVSGLCAYVIPTYELDERVHFPTNKTDLVRLANKGLARPFHHKVFIYNQFATNFSRWQQTAVNGASDGPEVHISHPVTNFEFLYEPFYVAPDTVPPHDERFVGYGYTRNTQVYEMFVAGYEFHVLSPIFTCHWGLQLKRNRPPWRERQNSQNRRHFEVFKREVFARYHKDPLNMLASRKQHQQQSSKG